MKRKAFSLVELSMVMVIIAVLVTGVTGGSKLMETSRLNKVALQLNNIVTSVETFELAYKGLPGDLSNAQDYFGGSLCVDHATHAKLTCNGDGNDAIGSFYSGEGKEGEHAYVYLHMQLADVYRGMYSPNTLSDALAFHTVSDLNTPSTDVAGTKVHYAFWGTNTLGDARYKMYVGKVRKVVDANIGKPYDSAFSSNMIKKIDRRIDDGDVLTGRLRKSNGNGDACSSNSDEITCKILYYERAPN